MDDEGLYTNGEVNVKFFNIFDGLEKSSDWLGKCSMCMKPVGVDTGKTCGDDDPWTLSLEVVENRTNWIDRMIGHEIFDHRKKTQHVNNKVGVRINHCPLTCHTVSKMQSFKQVKVHHEMC